MQVNPPYKHLVQKRWLCGVTCLQMVLLRRGIWIEQEHLAKRLGTKVPESIKDQFYMDLPTVKDELEAGSVI